METVLFQPTRGHRCRIKGSWVDAETEPYEIEKGEALRRVRHQVGEIVGAEIEDEGEEKSDLLDRIRRDRNRGEDS